MRGLLGKQNSTGSAVITIGDGSPPKPMWDSYFDNTDFEF